MNKLIKRKQKIAQKASSILQLVPYINMIAICDSVAKGTAKEESDIDLFIICKARHIYTVRYFCVFWMTIFKLKCIPDQRLCKDKVSLSFFLSDDFLNLDRIATTEKNKKKRAQWITSLVPIFDSNHQYIDFIDKNSWVKEYKKNYYQSMAKKLGKLKSGVAQYIFRKLIELIFIFFIGWIVELVFRSIQFKKLYLYKHRYFGKEKMIINDKILKLHCSAGKCEGDLF